MIDESSQNEEINIFDAEEPTSKKLDYAIFFNQKLQITSFSNLYNHIMKSLFELNPTIFFSTNIEEKLCLTKDSSKCSQPTALNDAKTYFIESAFNSKGKFDRIKLILNAMDITDELYIKYA